MSSPRSVSAASPRPPSPQRGLAAGLAAALLLCLAASPASAQPQRISSAFGEYINIRLVPLIGALPAITSGPQPLAAGSGGPTYSQSANIAAFNVTTPLTGSIFTATLIGVNAAGDSSPFGVVTADATIVNPGLRVLGALPLLTLASDVIRSTATVGNVCSDPPNAVGTSDLVNARLGGLLGNIPIPLSPGPNTVLLNQLGIKVTLNEQILAVSGRITTLTVNAIHIQFAGAVTALGLLSGDIIVAQSKAQSECAVEGLDLVLTKTAPSSVGMGSTFDYTLTVRNNGAEPASGVTVSDALPPQVILNAYSPSQGNCTEGEALVCDLGVLGAGESATVVITVVAASTGTVVNTAIVSTVSPESSLANNRASATVTVRPPIQI